MLNVSPGEGQADSHLIELPDGRVVMIDVADAVDGVGSMMEYLRARCIRRIDLVVLSHFHRDHYDRLRDVIAAGIEIGRVAVNMPATNATVVEAEAPWGFSREEATALLQHLEQSGIPYFTPRAGERLIAVDLGDGTWTTLDVVCLFDGANTPVGQTDTNDTSMVLRLTHLGTRVLFTGDLNGPLGTWLATSPLDLTADLLKVPHHGTEGCAPDSFFARVNPRAAFVPAPRALWLSERSRRIREYFTAQGTPAFISGIHGHVLVTLNASGFAIQSERSSTE